jgi:hypothetical protein
MVDLKVTKVGAILDIGVIAAAYSTSVVANFAADTADALVLA